MQIYGKPSFNVEDQIPEHYGVQPKTVWLLSEWIKETKS